ncbi:MAG: Gfo/Idh/MocA family oxidoreductase [Candidatus Dormibacteraeota bacterium]|nr:Gfo/Idh/MocA family oxidoreductase [Candidatus Dormibacteraeota bacterium]
MTPNRVRWGILGAADVADRWLLPALTSSGNGEVLAIASRDPARAAAMAARHQVPRVHRSYDELLGDPDLDAVYVPLPNSLHREWTLRALAAGKHVLCEKPLAMDAAEASEMAAASRDHGRLLMEAAMYRFLPRMKELAEAVRGRVRYLHAGFGFPIDAPDNYRMDPELGGGALLDVGFYVADVARWLLGEPQEFQAVRHDTEVDMSWSVALGFPGGEQAGLFASFETPEYQELVVVTDDRVIHVDRPFGLPDDPGWPYRRMVEAFAAAILDGDPEPLPLINSIATAQLLDRIREAATAV